MTGIDTPERDMLAGSAARFLATAQALTDGDLCQASALPGWTRAHVLTHLAQAADSRTGLLRAARAGRVGRQYPSEQARADAIDAGARRPPAAIRADLHRAVQDCLTAIREHPRHLWDAPGIWLGHQAADRSAASSPACGGNWNTTTSIWPPATSPPVDITGPPAALLAWLSGRSNGSGLHPDAAALPALPPLA